MKRALHIIWNIIQAIIIIYVIAVTTFMFLSNEYGYTEVGNFVFNDDQSDLFLIKKSNNIKENDTIYYYMADNNKYTIASNKVISIEKDNKNSLYKIENDTISGTKVIGKNVTKIKFLGSVLNTLESRVGFLFGVLLPILIVFVYQVYEFIVSIHDKKIIE